MNNKSFIWQNVYDGYDGARVYRLDRSEFYVNCDTLDKYSMLIDHIRNNIDETAYIHKYPEIVDDGAPGEEGLYRHYEYEFRISEINVDNVRCFMISQGYEEL